MSLITFIHQSVPPLRKKDHHPSILWLDGKLPYLCINACKYIISMLPYKTLDSRQYTILHGTVRKHNYWIASNFLHIIIKARPNTWVDVRSGNFLTRVSCDYTHLLQHELEIQMAWVCNILNIKKIVLSNLSARNIFVKTECLSWRMCSVSILFQNHPQRY